MKTIKILFAEDHKLVRNGIKLMLNSQQSFIPIIEEAKDGQEAITMAMNASYDVIILDINLPVKNGIEVTKHLMDKLPGARILALTGHREEYVVKQMLEAGALGYILKNSGLEELTNAILSVHVFKKYYSNDVSQVIINKNHTSPSSITEIPSPTLSNNLSDREVEVLRCIAQEMTNNEIGAQLSISPRTAGNHRNKLIQKLKVKNSVGLAMYAARNGIA